MRGTKRIGQIIKVSLALGLVALTATAFIPKPLQVSTATIARGPLQVTVEANGKTRVRDLYTVTAPAAGLVNRITLEPGDPVDVGTLITQTAASEPPLLDGRRRAELVARKNSAASAAKQASTTTERARLEVAFAEREYARTKRLVDTGGLPARDLDQADERRKLAQKELDVAQFAAETAERELAVVAAQISGSATSPGTAVRVVSPVRGRVLRVLERGGTNIPDGKPLIELADIDALEIVADVLTTDAAKLSPGTPVQIDGFGNMPASGKVRRIEPSGFTKVSALGVEEQRVNVLVDVNPDAKRPGSVGDGYRVTLQFVIWEDSNVQKVPMSAVFRQGEDWVTYGVDRGLTRKLKIELGQRNAMEAEIKSGLALGQTVITYPSDTLTENAKVTVR